MHRSTTEIRIVMPDIFECICLLSAKGDPGATIAYRHGLHAAISAQSFSSRQHQSPHVSLVEIALSAGNSLSLCVLPLLLF